MKLKYIRVFFLFMFLAGLLPVALKHHWFYAVAGGILFLAFLAEGISLWLSSAQTHSDLTAWAEGRHRFGDTAKDKFRIRLCLLVVFAIFVLSARPSGGFHIGHYFNGPLTVKLIPDPYGINVSSGYYPLQAEAFLKGQLHLDIEPHPGLKELENPYDPAQNHSLRMDGKGNLPHDIAYYNGKFYAYWGPVPALLLYVPFEVLKVPRQFQGPIAMLIFAFGAFLFQIVILLRMTVLPPGKIGFLLFALAALVLGIANSRYFMLYRPLQYEVAIAAGGFFIAGALYFALGFMTGAGIRRDAALTSLFLGLAVGSRINLAAPASLILAAMVVYVWKNQKDWWGRLVGFAAILVPFIVLFGGHILFNYVRNDSPIMNYGLTASAPQESTSYPNGYRLFGLLRGLHVYLFAWPEISSEFPFVRAKYFPPFLPNLFPGALLYWRTISGFFCYPIFLGLPLFLIISVRESRYFLKEHGKFLFLFISLILCFLGGLAVLCLFPYYISRYVGDFDVAFALAAVVSWFWLLQWSNQKLSGKWHGTVFVIAVCVFILFSLASIWTGYANYYQGEWHD